MEKKASRTVQSSTKGLGTDSKKNQDVTGKLWPRNGRRREPTGGSFPPKSDASRKPTPQKNRALDKRPRARGGYYAGPAGGKEGAQVEEAVEPELGSVFVQGSKKQSLNHLLNFHYAPREPQLQQRGPGAGKAGGHHRWLSTSKHKYNKEQFIQANCQFIVNSSGDYRQYMNNPDALVDWSLIEQVNVQVHELPSCPICLYPPVAAKMTRCGHVYCWSCLLHYLALSEKAWQKCPICYESVHKQDLKSVVPVPHSSFNTNETITFKLMKRARGSLIAYPEDEPVRQDESVFYMSDKQAGSVYCKLLLADNADVMSIIEREKNELQTVLLDEDNNPEENCFVEQSIALLRERENVILCNLVDVNGRKELNAAAVPFVPLDNRVVEGLKGMKVADGRGRERLESYCSDDCGNVVVGENVADEEDCGSSNQQAVKYFYFYQASDGQHIYLHALNVRMLEHTYGSLEFSPKTLTGRIVEKEGGSMTEELRKRLRYLQHLPVTCQFEVAEIQLGAPVVSKETLKFFEEQIDIRKKRRQRRARDEKRREKKIAEEENRQMGKYPVANIELESPYQFPEFGVELGARDRTISMSTSRSASPVSERHDVECSTSIGTESSGPSFAKMLSSAKKQNPKWPDLNAASPPVSAPRLINVTGSKTLAQQRVKKQSDSEPECEDYIPAPEYNRSFSNAIALALEKAAKSNEEGINGEGKSGKKKKKNKQKVLFATSMAYSGN